MRYYTTPLRYPGGKGKLANYIKLLFLSNGLLDSNYVEPYAGGAGVALSLLFDEYASRIHINDLDASVYAFWHSVLYETDALCRLISDTEVTIEEWHRQKNVQNHPHESSPLELGFSTFFLNRTNRSGITAGGVIGGKRQDGDWKLDARYNKDNLIKRIQRTARYRSRIRIYNQDAAHFLQHTLPTLPPRTLVYLDPPYYVKGQGLYKNYYQHEDHERIAELVAEIPQHWIVSYDHLPQVMQLYEGRRHIVYHLSYSAAERYKGKEVMFFCDHLSIPQVDDPAKVDSQLLNDAQLRLAL